MLTLWLNGSLSPTQRALGAESDNVFIARARNKMKLDTNFHETDTDSIT